MGEIGAATVVRRSAGEISVEVDGGFILMSPERDEFYDLNRTATRIWALLETPLTVAELSDRLIAAYDVEPDACRRQVIDLLNRLAERGMVDVVP